MGSNHEKNGGQKSRDTLPLTVKYFCADVQKIDTAISSQTHHAVPLKLSKFMAITR